MANRIVLFFEYLFNKWSEGLRQGNHHIAFIEAPTFQVYGFFQHITLNTMIIQQIDQIHQFAGIMLFFRKNIVVWSLGLSFLYLGAAHIIAESQDVPAMIG